MYTRKQIKSVLQEWKSFLSEAKKKPANPESEYVVRIFDFDGTIVTYNSPELMNLMKNSYMLSLLNEEFLENYKETLPKEDEESTEEDEENTKKVVIIPENVKKEINEANEAYICSKVKSVGYDKKFENAYDGTLKALIGGKSPDANFTNLFNFIKNSSVEEFDVVEYVTKEIIVPTKKSLGDIDPLPQIKEKFNLDQNIQKYLKTAKGVPSDKDLKIRSIDLLNRQKERILQTVTENGLNIPDENIVVTLNVGEQKETPIEGGGSRLETVRGTSGKIADVMEITRRVISSLPEGTKVKFELYDNVSSNLAEMMDGVRKALPGYTGIKLGDASNEEEILAFLRERLDESKYYNIVGKDATPSTSGIEYTDTVGRVSKSKKQGKEEPAQESEEGFGPYKKQFQQIKNGFQALKLKLIATTGGRPVASVITAFDQTLAKYAGGTVINLNSNLSSATATTGLEKEFSQENRFKTFVDEMRKFVSEENYNNFKNALQPLLDTALSTHGQQKAAKAAKKSAGQLVSRDQEIAAADELESDQEYDDNEAEIARGEVEHDDYFYNLKRKGKLDNWLEGTYPNLDANHPLKKAYDRWSKQQKGSLAESVRRQNKPLLREFKLVLKSKK